MSFVRGSVLLLQRIFNLVIFLVTTVKFIRYISNSQKSWRITYFSIVTKNGKNSSLNLFSTQIFLLYKTPIGGSGRVACNLIKFGSHPISSAGSPLLWPALKYLFDLAQSRTFYNKRKLTHNNFISSNKIEIHTKVKH